MIASVLVLILLSSAFTLGSNPIPYTGYRITLSKQELANAYYGVYKAATTALTNEKWADYSQTYGSGLFSLGFYVSDVKCASANFDSSKAELKNVATKDATLEVELSGNALVAGYTFSYEFKLMGMSFFFGTGALSLSSKTIHMVQEFTDDSVSTKLTVGWNTEVSKISGSDPFGGVIRWLVALTNDKLAAQLNAVYGKAVQQSSAAFYKQWAELKTPFYNDGSLNMVLRSFMQGLGEFPQGYISFGYDTRVTVEDRPYNKMVWKMHYNDAPIESSKAQVCVAAGLVASMVEVRGKARDFLFRLTPTEVGFPTGKLSDLSEAMPMLGEVFTEDEDMTIGCRPNGDNDIVMIKDGLLSENVMRLQVPINCMFGAMPSGKLALSVNFVVRASVTKEYGVTEAGFVSINGFAKSPALYSFKSDFEIVPVEQNELVGRVLSKIVAKLENFKILPEPLAVPLPFKPATHANVITKDEYCFNYA